MIYSRKYSRNFIPLRQHNSRYAFDFRPALGRCLIEIKNGLGNVNFYAQGIKPDVDYELELINADDNNIKIASLGKFSVDTYGKGEAKMSFNPDEVGKTGEIIENFNVVILVPKNAKSPSPALVGYIGSEIPWQEKYEEYSNKSKKIDVPEEKIKIDTRENEILDSKVEIETPCNNELTETEIGLIAKEKGLVEREKGLIDKKNGLEDKSKDPNSKGDLSSFEKALKQKEDGLSEKADGLLEKEKALSRREELLNDGNIGNNNECIQDKEVDLIKKEDYLVNKEQDLLDIEKQLIRKNPNSQYEKDLILKEKELLKIEQNLLTQEKELLEKEKELLKTQSEILGNKTQETGINFGETIKNITKNIKKTTEKIGNKDVARDYGNYDFRDGKYRDGKKIKEILKENLNFSKEETKLSEDSNINYIRLNNARMTPFKNVDDEIIWYRISPIELSAISKSNWKLANNIFVTSCYKKYKHLILGITKKDDKEIYTLGIPCVYDEEFYPAGELKDFKIFMPVDSEISVTSIKNGEHGYRLSSID